MDNREFMYESKKTLAEIRKYYRKIYPNIPFVARIIGFNAKRRGFTAEIGLETEKMFYIHHIDSDFELCDALDHLSSCLSREKYKSEKTSTTP
jgi:hypothetical protein